MNVKKKMIIIQNFYIFLIIYFFIIITYIWKFIELRILFHEFIFLIFFIQQMNALHGRYPVFGDRDNMADSGRYRCKRKKNC